MDYKIKFEYKGAGQQAANVRNRAIQAQKNAERKAGGTGTAQSQNSLNSIKALNSSIQKLISSNAKLENALMRMAGGRGGGGFTPRPPSPGGGGGRTFGGSAGFGRIGSAIPILGAGIAALGFSIQKINQIANAYINLAGQQVLSAGMGRFRHGQGIYRSAEMGAAAKSYGIATGRYANAFEPSRELTRMGAAFGMGGEDLFRQAGIFQRSGGDVKTAAYTAAGMGIETEIPTLLSGISSELEEAVKNGVNASDMSTDFAKEVSILTQKTSTRSVDAALNIIKSFKGVKTQLGRGKVGSLEGMYATRATQQMLAERITGAGGAKFLGRLTEEGAISERQRKLLSGLGTGATFEDIRSAVGPAAAQSLFKQQAMEANPAALARRTVEQIQGTFGTSPEAFQRAANVLDQTGAGINQNQLRALWQTSLASKKGVDTAGIIETGKKAVQARGLGVEQGRAGIARTREIGRENLILRHGASFARESLKMEKAMIRIANEAAPYVVKGMEAVGDATTSLVEGIDTLSKKINSATDEKGEFSFTKFMGIKMPSIFD